MAKPHTITITRCTERQVKVEVTFPIYRRRDVGGDHATSYQYTRIIEIAPGVLDVTVILIGDSPDHRGVTEYHLEHYTAETHRMPYHWTDDEDYVLGRKEHALTAEQFDVKLHELRVAVAAVKTSDDFGPVPTKIEQP